MNSARRRPPRPRSSLNAFQCIKLTAATDTVITNNKLSNLEKLLFSNSTDTVFRENSGFNYQNVSLEVIGGSCFSPQSDPFFNPLC